MTRIGVVAPGQMGTALGACLVAGGHTVYWPSEGRGAASRERADAADFIDVGDLRSLCAQVDVLISICPPHAALEVAGEVAGLAFQGIYLEANAIAPDTTRRVAELVTPSASIVDGGIVGPPPTRDGTTRLYLAGSEAGTLAELFSAGPLSAVVLDRDLPAASALKLAYAAWTKGSRAMLLAARAYATAEGVEDGLLREWEQSQPGLIEHSEQVATTVSPKAWRWAPEMQEVASAFAAVGLPPGLHTAAAEVFDQLAAFKDTAGADIHDVVAELLRDARNGD